MRDTFEIGDTVQFTFTTSVAPDNAPILKITGITDSVVASITAQQSTTTAYYAMYTTPTSNGVYMGEWYAQKTVASSAYDFRKKFLFNVITTQRSIGIIP